MAYNPYAEASARPMSPQQALAQKGLGPLAGGQPGRRRGSTDTITTSPLNVPKDDGSNVYGGQPKPLSAEAIRALGMKRLAADQAYQQALAGESSGIQRFQASFNAAKQKLTRAARNTTEETARKFAGRGVARNPMQMGRAAREIESSLQENIGEAKFTLATEIEALKLATEQARIERDKILADIELEEALLRSSPDLYFQGA